MQKGLQVAHGQILEEGEEGLGTRLAYRYRGTS